MLKTASSVINAIGALNYAGTWNANTNSPTLTSGVGTKGNYYVVSVAGTTTLDGINLWSVGDWAVFNGTAWQKVDGASSEAFSSITVTGLTGYMYANNTSPVTASLTIPNSGLANSTATLGNATITLGSVTSTVGNLTLNNVTINSGNITANLATSTSIPVANATGTLAASNGGTGLTSLTAGYIPYGNGTSAFGSSSNFTFNNATTTLTLTGGGLNAYSVYATGGLSSTIGAINFFGASNSSVSPAVEIRQGYTSKDALTITTTATLTSSGKLINASDGTNTFVVNGGWNGNIVGVGTSSPNTTLDVTGPASGYYGGGSFRIGAGTTGGTTDCWLGQYSAVIGGGGQQDFIFKNFGTGALWFATNGVNVQKISSSSVFPVTDNSISLGGASNRWSVVYSATALINTSDANQKQQIQSLTVAEQNVAKSIKNLFKTFKYNSAVAKKGENARIHIGVIAQDVQSAFVAEGLDPNRYALFCSDTWYEYNGKPVETDENGIYQNLTGYKLNEQNYLINEGEKIPEGSTEIFTPVQATQVTQLGIRYDELLSFVIASL